MIKMLNSQMLNVGTKFVVTEESTDSIYGPGTTGFVSFVKGRDRDYPNVVFLQVVITKRGKTGKDRLDTAEISTPIFDINSEEVKKILPEEKRRYYVHIKVFPVNNYTINMATLDFVAWASAYTQYIYKLGLRAEPLQVWPKDSKNILNEMLVINDTYNENHELIEEKFSSEDFRRDLVMKIRKKESALIQCAKIYTNKITAIELRAITDLSQRNLKLDENIWAKGVIDTTVHHFNHKSLPTPTFLHLNA